MKRVISGAAWLSMVLLIMIVIWGCNSEGNTSSQVPSTTPGRTPWWMTDPNGDFNTYDLARAQNEIPFHIIVPSYLPSDFQTYPYIKGPLKGSVPDNEVEVLIEYPTKDPSKGYIMIIEYNYFLHPPDPSFNPDAKAVIVANTALVEYKSLFPASKGRSLEGFEFYWNQSGITFDVGIYGYDYNEAVKILESMIQQGKATSSIPSSSQ